jgi:hypothetical protein
MSTPTQPKRALFQELVSTWLCIFFFLFGDLGFVALPGVFGPLFEQERIRKDLIEKSPNQLKMPFALWTRDAVRLLVKEIYGYDLPIRTICHYLKRWNFTPQKPIKRAYERNDKKVIQWIKEDYPALSQRTKKEGSEIHWGDETGICSQDQIGRDYAPNGKTPVRKERGIRE